ncbi:MAG: type II toxin-antitoxin system RelE/ParE family toxin [Spirochaetia bacterium]
MAVVYKLVYLPLARQDMVDITGYISRNLANPQAAMVLAEELVKAISKLAKFPYTHAVYFPIRPLQHEYRKLIVRNYLVLYRVDEEAKTVTITRVLYAKRDISRLLQ